MKHKKERVVKNMLQIVTFKAAEFIKCLPKDRLWFLQGVHDDKPCYYASYNGKEVGIIYDMEHFKSLDQPSLPTKRTKR